MGVSSIVSKPVSVIVQHRQKQERRKKFLDKPMELRGLYMLIIILGEICGEIMFPTMLQW